MKMLSPIVAMLWENWRLTRVEMVQRLGLGIVAASGAMVLFDAGAPIALAILVVVHSMIWFSIAKLNGGRFMDGYKPGFPFDLLHMRPVPTVVYVGVAFAYDAISCTALYIVSAALVGFLFGQPFPLFSVVVWMVSFHFAYACIQWATRSRVVQWVASIAICWPLYGLLHANVTPSLQVVFSLVDNAVMVLIGVVSFCFTAAGVARQRRGDAVATEPRKAGSGAYPDWLINLFRLSCPTSSATKAQVWFEFKSGGLPVLMIGSGVAMMIFLLFAISVSVAPMRTFAIGIAFMSVPITLFLLSDNAFGIRRKQGRRYASLFEATLPYSTAQLAGLKVLVRTVCALAAVIAIGVSVWASSSLAGVWSGGLTPDFGVAKNAVPGFLKFRQDFAGKFAGLTGYGIAALGVIAPIAVASLVAWQAAREALRVRYPRGVLVVQSLPVVWGLTIMLLALAGRHGIASASQVGVLIGAIGWITVATILFSSTYLLWSGFMERVLTIRYACGALVISAAFGAAWLTLLNATGAQLAPMTATKAIWFFGLVPLVLMQGFLAPWSLNRVRHA